MSELIGWACIILASGVVVPLWVFGAVVFYQEVVRG